jgi:hypothetical protein
MNAVLIAPGESLTQEQCDTVRGAGVTIAVGDAYKLAPWCDAIAATDRAWWSARPDAMAMPCKKFSPCKIEGIEQVTNEFVGTQSSSGVLGLWVAKMLGAAKVLMIGFDNRGTHFFGAHVGKLKNTPPHRFKTFEHQFVHLRNHFKIVKIAVRNATPGTALQAFEKATLTEGLAWLK